MKVVGWLALGAVAAAAIGCSSNSSNDTAPRPIAAAQAGRTYGFTSDVRVRNIMAGACFDCHAQQSASSWTVVMAPSYWFRGSARRNLDFSDWNDYDAARRSATIAAIGRVVTRGEMPPWDYTIFHPGAELTNEQKDIVSDWAMRESEALPAH
ncbi:MAG: heme-binding domain-containing protein [Candidatus Binataceae bacterium]|nr:heme-binding domain-containing protein [Candidatus Binataceae bacterium]